MMSRQMRVFLAMLFVLAIATSALAAGQPDDTGEANLIYDPISGNVKLTCPRLLYHPLAMFNLATMYDDGKGVPKDAGQAASWYRKAAELGDADAMYSLGSMYDAGEGVPQDDNEAANWYHKAAELGNANAMYDLGLNYASGRGVVRDGAASYTWLSLAAAFGHEEAQEHRDAVGEQLTIEERLTAEQCAKESFEKAQGSP